MANGSDAEFPFITTAFKNAPVQQKFTLVGNYAKVLGKLADTKKVKDGVNQIKDMGIRYKAFGVIPFVLPMLDGIQAQKEEQAKTATGTQKADLDALAQYIGSVISELKKKQ
jgi:aminopeptidase N